MSESVQPNPPRYRLLKRSLLIAGLALLAVLGLRGWWGHVQDARLNAVVA